MAVTVVVPWRGGCPARERALAWCREQWPWPVVLGEHNNGDWCKAAAVANGLTKTDADIIVIADADVWCPTETTVEAIASGAAEWGHPHRGIRRLTETATTELVAGTLNPHDIASPHLTEPPTRAHPGGGVVVIRRTTYERVPFDRRFRGWGHEDDAFGWALEMLAGLPAVGRERLIHLWHPPQDRTSRQRGSAASFALQEQYWLARRDRQQMIDLVEAGR